MRQFLKLLGFEPNRGVEVGAASVREVFASREGPRGKLTRVCSSPCGNLQRGAATVVPFVQRVRPKSRGFLEQTSWSRRHDRGRWRPDYGHRSRISVPRGTGSLSSRSRRRQVRLTSFWESFLPFRAGLQGLRVRWAPWFPQRGPSWEVSILEH